MGATATTIKVPRRISVKENKTDGILNYDVDNAYPQRVLDIIASSGTAQACVNLYAKFIEGRGFRDLDFAALVVNREGLTMDKVLRAISWDYARFRGFALHFNYNGLFQPSEISLVPFENARMGVPDDVDYIGKIALYDDWGRRKRNKIDKNAIDFIDVFNPDPEVVAQQVETAGGLAKYKGQILYYTPELGVYPTARYDAVLEDIVTDGEVKVYRHKSVRNGFSAGHVLVYPGRFENDAARKKFMDEVKGFQGSDDAGSIIVVEAPTPEHVPNLLPFEVRNNATLFESTQRTAKDSIIECFNIPNVLLNVLVAGKLGTSNEMQDAKVAYDDHTNGERRMVEEVFTRIFSYWPEQVNPTGDYSVIPTSFAKQDAPALVTVLGVGGTQALAAMLESPTKPADDILINRIVVIFGLDKERATAIVKGGEIPTT